MIKHPFFARGLLAILLLGSIESKGADNKKTLKAFPVKTFKLINIQIENGSLQITRNPDTPFTQVQCVKKTFDDSQCDLNIENKDKQTLVIEVKKKDTSFLGKSAHCEVDFVITVPNAPDIAIRGGDVTLDTKGLSSSIQVETGHGTVTTIKPKKLHVTGGKVSITSTDTQGDTTIDAGHATVDLTYTSLTPAPRLIQLSGGTLEGKVTIPLAAKIDNKIESAVTVKRDSDPAPHFILTGAVGSANLSIVKAGEPGGAQEKIAENFQMIVEPPLPPTSNEISAVDNAKVRPSMDAIPVSETALEEPSLLPIESETMDEEVAITPLSQKPHQPPLPPVEDETIAPTPQQRNVHAVLGILQPVLSARP